MPAILRRTALALNSITDNVLSGSLYEYARGAGVVSMAVGAGAIGVIDNISAGATVVAEAFAAPILTRYPVLPDEFYFNEVVQQADRLVIRAQNTTGGAIDHFAVVQLTFQG